MIARSQKKSPLKYKFRCNFKGVYKFWQKLHKMFGFIVLGTWLVIVKTLTMVMMWENKINNRNSNLITPSLNLFYAFDLGKFVMISNRFSINVARFYRLGDQDYIAMRRNQPIAWYLHLCILFFSYYICWHLFATLTLRVDDHQFSAHYCGVSRLI